MQKTTSAKKARLYVGFLLVVFALVLRLSYVNTVEIDHPIRADAAKYFMLAYNSVVNHSYSLAEQAPFIPSTYITPGYPLFLATVLPMVDDFPNFYSLVLNLQAVLGSLTVLLCYLIALRFMPLVYAAIASGLTALSPHLIAATGYFLTETLFIFWLALTLWLSMLALNSKKPLWFLLAGLACGLAALTRPVLLLYPVIPIVLLWRLVSAKDLVKLSSVLVVGLLLVWGPWQLWKSSHFNSQEASLAPASFALGIYPDLIFKNPENRGYPYADDPDYTRFSTDFNLALEVLKERASQAPWTYIRWYIFGKPAVFWQAENDLAAAGGPFIYPVISSQYDKSALWAYSLQGMFAVHMPLVVLGFLATLVALVLFVRKDQTHIELYLCGAVLLYFTGIHAVLTSLPRYSYPVIPYAYMMGVYFVFTLLSWGYRRRNDSSPGSAEQVNV